MMSILRSEWLGLLFRLILGGVFIYASLDKIVHPAGFAKAVHNYHLLPGSLVNIFAVVLPWLEFLCGAALILGTRVDGATTILGALLVVFLVAVTINLIRGVDIACGCFTSDPQSRKAGFDVIWQDSLLLLMAIHLFFRGPGRLALARRRLPTAMTP
ncbi:MAG: MauE/DoxX family redox-associated membrane protein [Candidatus Zixiibacteriota bacterium]